MEPDVSSGDEEQQQTLISRIGHAIKDVVLDDSAGPADTADPRPLGYGARTGEFGTVDSITNPIATGTYGPGDASELPDGEGTSFDDPVDAGPR